MQSINITFEYFPCRLSLYYPSKPNIAFFKTAVNWLIHIRIKFVVYTPQHGIYLKKAHPVSDTHFSIFSWKFSLILYLQFAEAPVF